MQFKLQMSRVAVLATGAVFLYIAFASAAWNHGYTQAELGMPTIFPDDPKVTMRRSIAEFHGNGKRVSDDLKTKTVSAFQYNLLQEEPFLFEAVAHMRTGNKVMVPKLLEEARRRNPRSTEVRIFLLDHYLSTGNVAASINEIGVLKQLLPAASEPLASTAINLLAEPKTREQAVKAIRTSPMRVAILNDLARYGASAYLILAITPDLKRFPVGSDGIVDAFINRGDVSGAFLLWAQMQSIDASKGQARIRNASFNQKPNPPFGWRLFGSPSGTAEIRDGSAQITHSGASSDVLLTQLLMLPPGSYRLSFETEKGAENATNFVWRLDCVGGSERLLELPLASLYSFEKQTADRFVVPPQGCPGQWIALAGRTLEIPKTRTIKINRVSIDQELAR